MKDLESIKVLAISKAKQSQCRYKISAIGINKHGTIIGSTMNSPRFSKYGGGNHAEASLIKKYGMKLKTIIICRVNNAGDLLPIDPCDSCKNLMNKLGIKWFTIKN